MNMKRWFIEMVGRKLCAITLIYSNEYWIFYGIEAYIQFKSLTALLQWAGKKQLQHREYNKSNEQIENKKHKYSSVDKYREKKEKKRKERCHLFMMKKRIIQF